jgi:diguanylate cyclase (GGDEF)-like protein/PAS domain S-box-containing protein
MIFSQIFETINTGLVVLNKDMTIRYWNRWMALHSGIKGADIRDKKLFDIFPQLNRQHFVRNCRSVLTFGHFSFFSHNLHRYLFPMPATGSRANEFEFMQQSCSMGPLRDANGNIDGLYISVQDVSETVSYQKKLVHMNQIDYLTGVYNRNFMESQLNKELARCLRFKCDLSLLMIDVDCFKSINDNYGHPCGDQTLKEITARIGANIRQTDYLIRYGGDEFCCILTETAQQAAFNVAEQLRQTICTKPFVFNGTSYSTSISLGVASFDPTDSTLESLLKKADAALYEAKRSGRNSVVTTTN